jgi:hypothetical protein
MRAAIENGRVLGLLQVKQLTRFEHESRLSDWPIIARRECG